MQHLPTLRQLQFFLAIVEKGSFSAAAEHIGVTQPTLSSAIQELEGQLGTQLLERGRQGVSLTAAGEMAAFRAARVVTEAQDLTQAVRSTGAPLTGLFRLGAIPTIAPFVLPRVLPVLRAKFANLQLYLREDLTARLIEGLRTRQLDAALIALPYSAPGMDTLTLMEDEFLLITPMGHPLASKRDLKPLDVAVGEMMLLEDGHCLRDHALKVCSVETASRTPNMGATSLHTLIQMVAGGLGISLLPRLAAQSGLAEAAGVQIVPFAQPVIGRSIGLIWRKGAARTEDIELIGRVLGQSLRAD
jgi:LysR family hydrogen peroxide-inducible transcriptional activator